VWNIDLGSCKAPQSQVIAFPKGGPPGEATSSEVYDAFVVLSIRKAVVVFPHKPKPTRSLLPRTLTRSSG
jgi:hypothetical protein